ncbi:MAG TPA: GTP 3',8-cyclase MoaA [Anaerolineaceae bacterium]
MIIDRFGRQVTYLRVSVTDRCNFRCVYCMPAEGIQRKDHTQMLRYEEIAEIVRVAAGEGVREVRLTGGEPLVRRDLPLLVRMIAAIPGIEDLSLTTNGLLLDRMAAELAAAGLTRLNVSLDTLNPQRFQRITRGGDLERVLDGLAAATEAGLDPVKINMVVMRGVNDDEIEAMARLTLSRPWQVRFIELMPLSNQAPWGEGFPAPETMFFSVQEMLEQLARLGLRATGEKVGSGPAREYRLDGALGAIGFISPLGQSFCADCNRLRLTADGHLRPCLMSDVEVPLLSALRSGQPLLPLLRQAAQIKPEGHHLDQLPAPGGRCMSQIGG